MDELEERDPAATTPEPLAEEEDERPTFLIVAQFFIIPMVVIAVCVGIFLLFGLLTEESRTASDYLDEVRTGSKARRYQAAYELSKFLVYEREAAREPGFVAELARLFIELRDEEPEVGRYLALALGQVADPRTVDALVTGLDREDPQTRIYAIWALGAIGDARAVPPLLEATSDPDPGVRKMAAHALGGLGDRRALPFLEAALDDPEVDVRWNAALSLGQLGAEQGVTVLHRMLDRAYLDGVEGITPQQKREAIINAVRVLALLADPASEELLESLSRQDPDLEVRSAARDALALLRGKGAPAGG